ncbi:MAG: hypothetical protein ACXWM7_00505 [Parachlamydiaceae bacterium]
MDQFVELLKQINIAQVFVIFAGVWFFYNRLDSKIEKNHEKLSSKIEDIDKRLCRIEGSLSTHGHCLFHQSNQEKKAE